jgi:putative Mn2+ efflux pump MntP
LALLRWLLLSIGVVFASSFDGFMVGISYSARGVSLNRIHYGIMAFCTGAMMGLSMGLGRFLTARLPNRLENYLGAGVLICLGLWQIWQGTQSTKQGSSPQAKAIPGDNLGFAQQGDESDNRGSPGHYTHCHEISQCLHQMLRVILDILKEPLKADRDLSGTIEAKEAWFLSIALGLDALAAGLGTSVAGFSTVLIPVAAAASPAFVYLGTILGRTSKLGQIIGETRFLPGLILITVGVIRLLD